MQYLIIISSQIIISTIFIISITGSALHGPCEGNEQCGTLDTYCRNGTCVCKDDFVVFYDHCIQIATPQIPCLHKSNCSTILGQKGLCKNQRCACKSFHHFHNQQCIKSRGLDESCDSDHQCYCGQNCKDKIECASGMCTCKYGFKKYGRRCIEDPSVVLTETPISESFATRSRSTTFVSLLAVSFFIQCLY